MNKTLLLIIGINFTLWSITNGSEIIEDSSNVKIVPNNDDKKEVTTKISFSNIGLNVGVVTLLTTSNNMGISIGGKAWYETPEYGVENSFEFYYGQSLLGIGATTSFIKFLSTENTSPFLSLGLGLTAYSFKESIDDPYYDENGRYESGLSGTKSFGALAPKIGGGVTFFRAYKFKLVIEGNYKANIPMFLKQGELDAIYHSLGLNIGFLRNKKIK